MSDQPLATKLARAQVAMGVPVTNGALEPVSVNESTCIKLLPLLDGSRDKHELASIIGAQMTTLESALNQLANMSLLVKPQ